MKKIFSYVFLTLVTYQLVKPQTAAGFGGFIQHLTAVDPSARTAIVDSFMSAQKGFPVTEDSMANFVYRGNVASSIVVTGDETQWSAGGEAMTNVPSTDLYFFSRKFEPDARIDYKFIKDANWVLDPLNQHYVSGGFGPNSELAMPAYVQPTEIQYDPAIPHGTISSFVATSIYTNNSRTIQVYLPPHYESSSRHYPTFYVHDGADYLALGSMANVLDNLIEAKQIQPIICVFVPPGADRAGEYRQSKIIQFTNFMVKELVPAIDTMYRTDARAAARGTMGSSDGGHISLYLAVNYSTTFGLVGGQSSTITSLFQTPIQNGPKVAVKFYLDVGTYDVSISGSTFLSLNRNFRDILLSKGYEVKYAEYHEGHSWGNWRAHIDDILKTLFPANASSLKTGELLPGDFRFYHAYPNPFNPATTIRYELQTAGSVKVHICNMLGMEVQTLADSDQSAGMHAVQWDAANRPSGAYFCTIEVNGRRSTQKIILMK